jgi:hypothetical protein
MAWPELYPGAASRRFGGRPEQVVVADDLAGVVVCVMVIRLSSGTIAPLSERT